MRIAFIFFFNIIFSSNSFGQLKITREEDEKCFSVCGAPLIRYLDTVQVVKSSKRKKIFYAPASYLVMNDTVQLSTGDSAWITQPGIYSATDEKVATGNGKSKNVTRYIVLQEPSHQYTRAEKKIKPIVVYIHSDNESKNKIELPATYSNIITEKRMIVGDKEIEVEVLCPNKLDELIIRQVQQRLKGFGFNTNNFSNELGETTIESLEKLQAQNELPIGGLNFPTLYFLGINF